MDIETEECLRELGRQLDLCSFPRVKNGGLVVPSKLAASPHVLGKEVIDAESAKRAAEEIGSRRWSAPGQQPPGPRSQSGSRPGTAGNTAPVVESVLRTRYADELIELAQAYPGTQYWLTSNELWLIVESSLLPGLTFKANIVVGISVDKKLVRAWAFWGNAAVGFEWIGPRHTNFPDGSICAFEPIDQTWRIGESLVSLFDLYTLWALRHLHLANFGRWPGYQSVPHVYERILELRADEYCGCSNSHRLYGECCMARDLARDRIQEAIKFTVSMKGGVRRPPTSIVEFLLKRKDIPPADVFL